MSGVPCRSTPVPVLHCRATFSARMSSTPANPAIPDENAIRDALRRVIDPEVGVNIVDLGLVYRISAAPDGVRVEMTMTSQACPMGDMVLDEAYAAVGALLDDATPLDVALVWEPPWQPEMMSASARQTLGWKGG